MTYTDTDIKAAMQAYDAVKVKHLNLTTAMNELSTLECPSFKNRVVLLVGPTGVGKSALVEIFVSELLARHRQEMLEDPSFIPVIKLTVPSPIYGDFDWKDAFSRILAEYNEVLIRRKVLQAPAIELDGEVFTSKRGLVKSELRRCIKNCIQHRRTKLLIMDEASHLLITRSRSTFLQQFELLKSLCEDFGVTLLLSGAYDLLAIQQFNGQLIRRTKIIHFARYTHQDFENPDSPAGQTFEDAVYTLLDLMPIQKPEELYEQFDYFYINSLGTIGLLKQWLLRAYERALREGSPILTQKILDQERMSNKELATIEKENQLGESRLVDIKPVDLAKIIGLTDLPVPAKKSIRNNDRNGNEESPPTRSLPNRSSRVGTRGPARDVAGEPL
jgi:energy-coupling factor transporter ATP-binding protein EcfA2